jgi:hypothetical protein
MDAKPPKSLWGPWSPALRHDGERLAQLRCVRTLVHMIVGSRRNADYSDTVKHLELALQRAEAAIRIYGQDAYLDQGPIAEARLLFDALPAARQRDIIATFAVLHKPLAPEKEE